MLPNFYILHHKLKEKKKGSPFYWWYLLVEGIKERKWLPISGHQRTSKVSNFQSDITDRSSLEIIVSVSVIICFLTSFCFLFSGFCSDSKELKDPEEINVVHPLDAQRGISLEDFRLIKLHMSNCMSLVLISLIIYYVLNLVLYVWIVKFTFFVRFRHIEAGTTH